MTRTDTVSCSLPGCDQEASLQWQRLASVTESGGRVQVTAESLRFNDEYRRATQRSVIRSLQDMREDWNPGLLADLDRQIAVEQVRLDAIQDTPMPTVDDDFVTVAVFACHAHAIGPDKAAELHEAGCLTEQPCACRTSRSLIDAHATAL